MTSRMPALATVGLAAAAAASLLASCQTVQPKVTTVARSVATLEKYDGKVGCGGVQVQAPDVQGWWNSLPAANRQHPFAGWESFRGATMGCINTRIDQYRAVTTFDLKSVAALKGLVTKAELVVSTRALPPAMRPGGVVTAGPFGQPGSVTLFCPMRLGGAGQLVRFGPNAPVPVTTTPGTLEMLGSNPFPSGSGTVYTLPAQFAAGPVAGATSPSVMAPDASGGAVITTDVTSQINAALNGSFNSISWMLTSNFEGPLPGDLPTQATFDCRTSYTMELKLTHL